jgi:hypothetical protein
MHQPIYDTGLADMALFWIGNVELTVRRMCMLECL